jgi:hypothetical protein
MLQRSQLLATNPAPAATRQFAARRWWINGVGFVTSGKAGLDSPDIARLHEIASQNRCYRIGAMPHPAFDTFSPSGYDDIYQMGMGLPETAVRLIAPAT